MSDTENKDEKGVDNAASSKNELALLEDKLTSTWLGRLKKMGYSQREWEAYLLEKLEKQEKASDSSCSSKGEGLFQRMKNFFKTPQESQFFIETETEEFINCEKEKLQEESPEKKEA